MSARELFLEESQVIWIDLQIWIPCLLKAKQVELLVLVSDKSYSDIMFSFNILDIRIFIFIAAV